MTVRSDVEEKEISTDKNSKYFRTRDRFSYSAIKCKWKHHRPYFYDHYEINYNQ